MIVMSAERVINYVIGTALAAIGTKSVVGVLSKPEEIPLPKRAPSARSLYLRSYYSTLPLGEQIEPTAATTKPHRESKLTKGRATKPCLIHGTPT
jgi:hypothetical protein